MKNENNHDLQEARRALEEELKQSIRLEWRPPESLRPHEKNPKKHPRAQRAAYRGFRKEIETDLGSTSRLSWFGAALYNERTGNLLDGHMRQEDAIERGEEVIPVLIVDVPAEVEAKILAFLDPIGGMNQLDQDMLHELMESVEVSNKLLLQLLDDDEIDLDEEVPTSAKAKSKTKGADTLGLAAGVELNYVVLVFRTKYDWLSACEHFDLKREKAPWSSTVGLGHVVNGARYLQRINDEREANLLDLIDDDPEIEFDEQ